MNIKDNKDFQFWMSHQYYENDIDLGPYEAEIDAEVESIWSVRKNRFYRNGAPRPKSDVRDKVCIGKRAEVIVRIHTDYVPVTSHNVSKFCPNHRHINTLRSHIKHHDLIDPATGEIIEIKAYRIADKYVNKEYEKRLQDAREKEWFVADRFIVFERSGNDGASCYRVKCLNRPKDLTL